MDNIPLVVSVLSGVALVVGLAAESALSNYSHSKLERMLQGDDRLRRITSHLKRFDSFALSFSLFNALMTVLFVGAAFGHMQGEADWQQSIGTFLAIFCALGFGLYGLVRGVVALLAERTLVRLMGFIVVIGTMMTPISSPLRAICGFLGRLMGAAPEATEEEEAMEEILDAVAEGEAEGVLQETAADFIENIIEFKDRVVREVMTPRTSVNCISADESFDAALKVIRDASHSRFPVYVENRDNISGILYVKDLLRNISALEDGSVTLSEISRKPVFVPETKKVSDLLQEFQQAKVQIAIVIDEFGGTSGLVTVEDIVEEIVGELEDEFDEDTPRNTIHHISENIVELDAAIEIEFLNEQLGVSIPEAGDYETLGGFLSSALGKVPSTGENVGLDGLLFDVTEADERRVKRVRLTFQLHEKGA